MWNGERNPIFVFNFFIVFIFIFFFFLFIYRIFTKYTNCTQVIHAVERDPFIIIIFIFYFFIIGSLQNTWITRR